MTWIIGLGFSAEYLCSFKLFHTHPVTKIQSEPPHNVNGPDLSQCEVYANGLSICADSFLEIRVGRFKPAADDEKSKMIFWIDKENDLLVIVCQHLPGEEQMTLRVKAKKNKRYNLFEIWKEMVRETETGLLTPSPPFFRKSIS